MADISNQDLRETLVARRDAFTAAIQALDACFGAPQSPAPAAPAPAAIKGKTKRTVGRVATRRGRLARRQPAAKMSSEPLVLAREEAIVAALKRNGGLATSKILRAAMPKEPSLTDEQRGAAYRNCVQRLKVKRVIDRTGDTWSLVGVGSEG